jgi:hypothetical protein
MAGYLALVLLVALLLVVVLMTLNPGLLGHLAGLRQALGLSRG